MEKVKNYLTDLGKRKNYIKNIRENKVFIFSSFAFSLLAISQYLLCYFIYSVSWSVEHRTIALIGISFVGFLFAIIYAMCSDNLSKDLKNASKPIKILTYLATITTIFFYAKHYSNFIKYGISDENYAINLIFTVITSLLAMPFVAILYAKIYTFLGNIFKKIFKDITKRNKIAIVIGIVFLIAVTVFTFVKAPVFYANDNNAIDVIYSSDTNSLVKDNAWQSLYHPENDVRQPLFALFSMPFYFIVTLISLLIPGAAVEITGFGIGIVNSVLMVITGYIFASTVEKGNRKNLFLLFYLSTFACLLHVVMLEQYVPMLFWVSLLIYMYVKNIKGRSIPMIASAGTLITNMVLFPLEWEKEDTKTQKIEKTVSLPFRVLLLGLVSGLTFTFIRAVASIMDLIKFTGTSLSFTQKFEQYSHFIVNCFTEINGVGIEGNWHLQPITTINFVGIALFILAFISLLLNKKDKIQKISFAWVIYSFIILCVVGWGTAENGLPLYTLYFMWAFAILIYNFFKNILKEKKHEKILYLIVTVLSVSLLILNLISLYGMVNYLGQ